jgi:phage FluMu protein Com
MTLTNLLKGNKNASYEVVVRCPHCGQRLMDAEYVVARIKCPRCKNYVMLRIENK